VTARTAHTAQVVEIRSRDADRSREEILRAAMTEFADHGFGGARIEAIAERAGVNKKLIYYYYAAKDELFLAVLEQNTAVDWRTLLGQVHVEPDRGPEPELVPRDGPAADDDEELASFRL